ncbi:MAG TPA: hypothetical protein P5509_05400 [Bacteroidales bacterium]|nr:hypothetical protein [Bacteroidales bacterium]
MKNKIKINSPTLLAFLIFASVFLLLFVPFPLNKTIGGTCDALLTIASGNFFGNFLQSVFGTEILTSSLYPGTNILQWGESAVGLLFLFNFLKILGCNDILSWYFYVVTIFSLNSLGVFVLSHHYTKNFFLSILGGILFAFTNFAFVNIDDAHVFFYFFTAISVVLLLRYKKSGKIRLLYIASIISALQIYFSIYVFVYGTLVFTVFFIYATNLFQRLNQKKLIQTAISFGFYLLTILPFVIFYWLAKTHTQAYIPEFGSWNNIISNAYLNFSDFFRVMPNNIVYPSEFKEVDVMFSFFEMRKSAFIGTFLMSAGLFFSIKYYKKLLPWIIVAVLGFTFSSYPYKILSSNIEFFEIIRLPYRAYFISNLAVAVIAVVGISEILKKINKKQQFILIFLIAIIHIAENIPYPFPLSDYEFIKNEISINYGIKLQSGFDAKNIAPSTQLIKAVKTNTNEESVLLCLPSNRIFGEEHGMFCYNRELIYMNHQSYFNRNMFNGVHGYFPNSRIEIQNKIDKLPTQVGLLELSESGLTHIVYYKNMIIDSKDDIIEELKTADVLILVEETKDYIIFELK